MTRLALLLCLVSQAFGQDFESGFEEPVRLSKLRYEGGDWRIGLEGADQGSDWATDLPDDPARDNYFTCLVGKESDPKEFVRVKLAPLPKSGIRSLFMEYVRDDPARRGSTRIQFNLFPKTDSGRVSYWLFLQHDLADVLGSTSFRQVMEWVETGRDYRFNVFIKKRDGQLRWIARGERGIPGPMDWEVASDTAVPTGRWIELSCSWHTHPTDGYLVLRIDGKVVLEHKGRTKRDSGLLVFQPLKIYVGDDRQVSRRGTLWQLVDDIRFEGTR